MKVVILLCLPALVLAQNDINSCRVSEDLADAVRQTEPVPPVSPDALLKAVRRYLLPAAERSPGDVLAQVALLLRCPYRSCGDIKQKYQIAFQQHPEFPAPELLNAISQIGVNTPAAITALESFAKRHPESPYPDLALSVVEMYAGFANYSDAGERAARFAKKCPDYLPAYRGTITAPVASIGTIPAELRKRIAGRTDAQSLSLYRVLWTLEFKQAPPDQQALSDQHGPLREQVRRDLETMAKAEPKGNLEALLTLREGYQLIGDQVAREALLRPDDIAVPDPGSEQMRWQEANPFPPANASAEEKAAHQKKLALAAQEWMAHWPESAWPALRRFTALAAIPDTPDAELLSAADAAIDRGRRDKTRRLGEPPLLVVAQLLETKGLQLDRIPTLVEEALRQSEEPLPLESDLDPKLATAVAANRLMTQIDAQILGARLALRASDTAHADRLADTVSPQLEDLLRLTGARGLHSSAQRHYRELQVALAEARGDTAAAARYRAQLGESTHSVRPAAPAPSGKAALKAGDPFPPFHLEDISGKKWSLDDLKNRVTVMSAWATWCAPCVEELPALQALADRVKGREDVQVVSLNLDDNPGVIQPFLRDRNFHVPVLIGTASVEQATGGTIPHTWVLVDGKVHSEASLFERTAAPMEAWLDEMLKRIDAARSQRQSAR